MNATTTNLLNLDDTALKTAINLGVALADAKQFDLGQEGTGLPAVLVPAGYEIKTFPELREWPQRIEQAVIADTPDAWLGYWNRYANPSSTAFFDVRQARLVGILDYHDEQKSGNQPECAHFGDHRVLYVCPKTPEWTRWLDKNGKRMKQDEMALFIEDAIPDITSPPGAEMLEIVRTLQASNKLNFRSAIRLDNGETQFVYEENLEGKAGTKGQLKIPHSLQLGIRLFEGGPGYALEARFRYTIKDGALTMWYDLVRPERAHELAVMEAYAQIETGLTTGHLYRGTP